MNKIKLDLTNITKEPKKIKPVAGMLIQYGILGEDGTALIVKTSGLCAKKSKLLGEFVAVNLKTMEIVDCENNLSGGLLCLTRKNSEVIGKLEL